MDNLGKDGYSRKALRIESVKNAPGVLLTSRLPLLCLSLIFRRVYSALATYIEHVAKRKKKMPMPFANASPFHVIKACAARPIVFSLVPPVIEQHGKACQNI